MKYGARRSVKRLLLPISIFAALLVFGLVLLSFDQNGGIVALIIGGAPLLLLAWIGLAPGTGYAITESEVTLSRASSERKIPFSEIAAAQVLSDDEASRLLARFMEPSIESERNYDMRTWIQANRKYGELIKYCSVPVVQHRRSVGHSRNVVSYGAKAGKRVVLLRLRGGDAILVSPTEPERFVEHLTSVPGISANADPESVTTDVQIDPSRIARLRKKWRIYRIALFTISLAVVIAIIVPTIRDKPPDDTPVESVATVDLMDTEAMWIDESRFRLPISVELTNRSIEGAEDRRNEMLRLYDLHYFSDIAAALILDFENRHDRQLNSAENDASRSALLTYVESVPSELVQLEVSDANDRIDSVIDVYTEGLRDRIDEIVRNAVSD